ncbi:MAG: hypothetical protein ACRDVC_00455 [Acidimicrobiales bacterium]
MALDVLRVVPYDRGVCRNITTLRAARRKMWKLRAARAYNELFAPLPKPRRRQRVVIMSLWLMPFYIAFISLYYSFWMMLDLAIFAARLLNYGFMLATWGMVTLYNRFSSTRGR